MVGPIKRLYRQLKGWKRDLQFVPYDEADRLLKLNEGWDLAPEEDRNPLGSAFRLVYLERWSPPEAN